MPSLYKSELSTIPEEDEKPNSAGEQRSVFEATKDLHNTSKPPVIVCPKPIKGKPFSFPKSEDLPNITIGNKCSL